MPHLTVAADRRHEQLRKLTEISRALTYTTAPEEILTLATTRATDLLEAESALLMLADSDGLLRVRATHGVGDLSVDQLPERLDETLVKRLQDVLGAPLQESFLGVPLVANGNVTGLLAVVRGHGRPITDEDEWLLSAVADQIAVALENARLVEEARQVRETPSSSSSGEAMEVTGATDRALATLSHDLRSPLNAIDSYAELIEMEILGVITDRQREALGRIRMSGRHLLAVLENVLEMTRLNAGVASIRADSVPAARVVEEAVLMVRPSASAKEQSLEMEADRELVVRADPDRLRQVLVNLLGNAIKYTQARGTLQVRASLGEIDGRMWGTIAVSDTGSGIPADKLQAVFDPYYRVVGPDGTSSEGTGLGLSISRELVRRMGGEIRVESELGRGSTFTLHLPLSAREG